MHLHQTVRHQIAESWKQPVNDLRPLQKLDPHWQMFTLYTSRSGRMQTMMGAETRIGPKHGRARDTVVQQKCEDFAIEKLTRGTGVFVEMNGNFPGFSWGEHYFQCPLQRACPLLRTF